MSRNTYLVLSILAILASTTINYASVGGTRSSRSYGGSSWGGGGHSSGWHK